MMFGSTLTSAYEMTRPTEDPVVPYTALDAVTNSLSSTTLIPLTATNLPGGSGYITKMRLRTNQTANTAQFRVWIFNSSSATVPADNVQLATLYANKARAVGYIDLPALAMEAGSGADCSEAVIGDLRYPVTCAADDNRLFYLLQTRSGFTPASAQKFYLEVTTDSN